MASAISCGKSILLQFHSRYSRVSTRFVYHKIIGLTRNLNGGFRNKEKALAPQHLLVPKFASLFNTDLPLSGSFSQNCDIFDYHKVCDETLDSLCEYFEDLVENSSHLTAADVTYGDGVLTVNFGSPHGTYVINRQSPNKQIWLSSPTSGPKRYDFETSQNSWIYKHSKESLHQLLQSEVSEIVKQEVNFFQCAYSGKSPK